MRYSIKFEALSATLPGVMDWALTATGVVLFVIFAMYLFIPLFAK